MTPSTGPSIIDLFLQSGLMAKLVLVALLLASVFCWAIIFAKWRALRVANRQNTAFLNVFWHGKSLDEIFAKCDDFSRSPVASLFKSGFKELKKLSAADPMALQIDGVANISRSLTRAMNTEIASLEKNISWLATTASAAPFVGLFGTVWGIMTSFQDIGASGAANLAVVAPGISEALVATAMGIGAAIPAVVGYNHLVNVIKTMNVDMDSFSQDFLNIVQRGLMGHMSGSGASAHPHAGAPVGAPPRGP